MYRQLFEACPGMTVLLIAHNMTTAAKADHIYVVQNGTISASGDYASLMRSDDYFDRLVSNQR